MASVISAGTSSSTALNLSGDTSGNLAFTTQAGANTITVPNATGTVILANSSNNLQMNSGYGSDATAYGCRAWVNFNGTGTVAIRASGNVSSITDNGTGDYRINFTNSMPDVNYSVAFVCSFSNGRTGYVSAYSTSSTNIITQYVSGTGGQCAVQDMDYVNVVIFR